jgi:two-component system, cell cycle sensor histidine kinase DivJ
VDRSNLADLGRLWRAPALPGNVRLDLFQRGRLAVAAASLCLAGPLAFAAGAPAIAMALILAGLLPAAVALDCRGADRLGRAAVATLFILGATMAGGILRGLPVPAAFVIIGLAALEAALIVNRDERRSAALAALAALGLGAAASWFTTTALSGAALWLAGLAAAMPAIFAAGGLCLGLAHVLRRKALARRKHIWQFRRGGAAMTEVVVAIDRTGSVVNAGRNARAILGLQRDALLGRGLSELTLVADRPQLLQTCSDSSAVAGPAVVRFRLRDGSAAPEPRYRWAELRLHGPLPDGLTLASLRDASDVVAREARASEAAAAAGKAEAARAAFLSTINHELRTPLNAIVGFSEFLSNPATTPGDPTRVREYAGIIHEAGHDLLQKVSAMIEITRIQAGAYELSREPTDVAVLARAAVESIRQERGLAPDAITVEGEPAMAEADARALRGALAELLSNALKHGRAEHVHVRISHGDGGVSLTVSDRGPGIAQDKLATLSGDLARADESLGRSHGGMGLGLTLARGIMRLHGGSVVIESPADGGVRATLRLAAAEAPAIPNIVSLADVRATGAAASPQGRRRKRA